LIKLTNEVIEIASSLVGVREKGQNRGGMIDIIQRKMGYIGLPYCVIFVLYCYTKACELLDLEYLFPATASTQTLYGWAKKQKITYTDPAEIKPGDIVIWRKFKLWKGHAALITSSLLSPFKDKMFSTIEGNTSNSTYGSQRDGDGIYKRLRSAKKLNFEIDNFYIRGFIDVEKLYDNTVFADNMMNTSFLPTLE